MPKPLFDPGQVLKIKGDKFEVVHVSSQQDAKGKPMNFAYEIRLESDMIAFRERNQADAEEQRKAAEAAAQEETESVDNPEDPSV